MGLISVFAHDSRMIHTSAEKNAPKQTSDEVYYSGATGYYICMSCPTLHGF